jgi:peptidyl-tRNA hydrolase, PTH1 family
MKLIVGLGNPGLTYRNTRHNIGFKCVDYLAKQHDIKFSRKKGQAHSGKGVIAGQAVLLAKPQTYMNLSGRAISQLINYYGIDRADLLVIHDDLDLPLGRLRIRQGGGSGGHKGIGSTGVELGGNAFLRIRVGIDRPRDDFGEPVKEEGAIPGYVLRNFNRAEKPVVEETLKKVAEAVACLLEEGIEAAQNRYNREF